MVISKKIQRILVGIMIFTALSAIGFSFTKNHVEWFWSKAPYIAILLIILTFATSKIWLLIDRQNQDNRLKTILAELDSRGNGKGNPLIEKLSDREREVLKKIGEGKPNKQIAEELFISLSTVKTHINNIYRILKVSNRKEAALIAKNRNEA
jgi:DNA-binding CsgD family transcriptional regulator